MCWHLKDATCASRKWQPFFSKCMFVTCFQVCLLVYGVIWYVQCLCNDTEHLEHLTPRDSHEMTYFAAKQYCLNI